MVVDGGEGSGGRGRSHGCGVGGKCDGEGGRKDSGQGGFKGGGRGVFVFD